VAGFARGDVDLLGEVVGDSVLVKRVLLEGCLKKDMIVGCAFFFLGFSAVTDGVILRLSSVFVMAVVGGVAASSATTSKAVGMMQQCGVDETGVMRPEALSCVEKIPNLQDGAPSLLLPEMTQTVYTM
jgi:hypothetical protein